MNHVMNSIKIGLLLVGLLGLSTTAMGQDYKSSFGVRLGTYVAASFSASASTSTTFEGLAGITREANQTDYVIGTYFRKHFQVSNVVPTLNLYTGVGALVLLQEEGGENKMNLAPGGIIGMEYTLEHAPANFFLDVSPMYKVNSNASTKFIIQASLGARYIFGFSSN